ncbi:esterase [Ramlibacter alkalitolerans]|uniref:Esterase n=1 Tax=Ramlibacter alkalitolerans TaxID=2039631 RepID=A0ABS1JRZ2_9BURK|nr:esterase [Ramlibacter alkalitolerans]MBL0426921.1 esterase [Ramlibacter alkalitolerans]
MNAALVIQSPAQQAQHLFLLFHGVGATPQDLVPLGTRLAREFPQAAVVSIPGPDRSDLGAGFQWFSVLGVTEENRPARVAATVDRFVQAVHAWQQRTGVAREATTLIGFSQGAIMALASTQVTQPPAARVVSLSGRYSELPQAAPQGVRLHFIHGSADPVIPVAHAQEAAQHLQGLAAGVTLDVVPGLPHGINRAVEDLLVQRLRSS